MASTDNKGVFALSPSNQSPSILSSALSDDSLPDLITRASIDNASSVDSADSSQPSLFTPCDDFFTPPPVAPTPLWRDANPSDLNGD
jgi:hypothetical protein